jgi:hypothetical protein
MILLVDNHDAIGAGTPGPNTRRISRAYDDALVAQECEA